jgi:hypothetical protein
LELLVGRMAHKVANSATSTDAKSNHHRLRLVTPLLQRNGVSVQNGRSEYRELQGG